MENSKRRKKRTHQSLSWSSDEDEGPPAVIQSTPSAHHLHHDFEDELTQVSTVGSSRIPSTSNWTITIIGITSTLIGVILIAISSSFLKSWRIVSKACHIQKTIDCWRYDGIICGSSFGIVCGMLHIISLSILFRNQFIQWIIIHGGIITTLCISSLLLLFFNPLDPMSTGIGIALTIFLSLDLIYSSISSIIIYLYQKNQ